MTETVALGLELVLSAILLVAASEKLLTAAAWQSARAAIMDRAPTMVWNAVPGAEIATAIALGVGVRPLAGVAALALFVCFTVVLVIAYRRGVRHDCNCFGALMPMRIGIPAIARAAGLGIAALSLIALGNPGAPLHPIGLAVPAAVAAGVSVFSSVRVLASLTTRKN